MQRIFFLILVLGATNSIIPSSSGLNPIRRLLCYVRGGDYLHPGDTAAIDTVLSQAAAYEPTIYQKQTIDIGCGYGGTVNYLASKGFAHPIGIDMDAAAIAYAKATYPSFTFVAGDATNSKTYDSRGPCGLLCLFSVIYAIKDKALLLQTLATIAEPGAILAIWDYTTTTPRATSPSDATRATMYPLILDDFKIMLAEAGWEFLKSEVITDLFTQSYATTLADIEKRESELVSLFGREVVAQTQHIYQDILYNLQAGALGGAALYARKKK